MKDFWDNSNFSRSILCSNCLFSSSSLEISSLELEVSRVLEKVMDGSMWLAVVLSSELAMPLCSHHLQSLKLPLARAPGRQKSSHVLGMRFGPITREGGDVTNHKSVKWPLDMLIIRGAAVQSQPTSRSV